MKSKNDTMLLKNIFTLITLLLYLNAANADLKREAEDAIKQENYSVAVEKYRRLADNNDVDAYLQLGKLYFEHGNSSKLTITESEALDWLIKASEASKAEAFYMLGVMYQNRQVSPVEVFSLYMQGAKLGSANAQESVAHAYQDGRGVERDLKKAFQWNLKAAEGGNGMAISQVIFAYANGHGTEPDDTNVIYWQDKAWKMGNQSAGYCLAARYEAGVGLKKDIKKAIELYSKFQGNEYLYTMDANLALGALHYIGDGVKRDLPLAKKYLSKSKVDESLTDEKKLLEHYSELSLNSILPCSFEKSAKKQFELWLIEKQAGLGDGFALYQLAGTYEPKDPQKAVDLYRRAASKGEESAIRTMGELYEDGRLVQRDEGISRRWYRKYIEIASAEYILDKARSYYFNNDHDRALFWLKSYKLKQVSEAQWLLGEIYLKNEVTKSQSIAPLSFSANAGNKFAQYTLGSLYFKGDEVVKSLQMAFDFYLKSANQGFSPAQYMIAKYFNDGLIESVDKSKAYFWTLLSSAQGYKEAKDFIPTIEKALPKSKILEIQKSALDWRVEVVNPYEKDYR